MKAVIVQTVKESPGIHFRELKREVSCSSTTLDYHITRSPLDDKHIRGYRRVFSPEISEELYDPLAALNHDTRGTIIKTVDENEQNLSSIAETVNKSVSTVFHHLKILRKDDLLVVDREDGSTVYSTSPLTEKTLQRYERLLETASDKFVDMWE